MKISDNCYAVTGLGFTPPWFVNAGIITGENGTIIIDAGGNYNSAATIYGYAKAVARSEKFLVINTEPHFDHILGNCFFAEKKIPVWGHPDIKRMADELKSQKWEMNETITDPARKKAHEEEVFFNRTFIKNPDFFLSDKQIFNLGSGEVLIYFTPGHTKYNLSVWSKNDRVLFTGDCIVNRYRPNLECGSAEEWAVWKESLKIVESLNPEVIVPGHGDVIFKNEISKVISDINDFLDAAINEN